MKSRRRLGGMLISLLLHGAAVLPFIAIWRAGPVVVSAAAPAILTLAPLPTPSRPELENALHSPPDRVENPDQRQNIVQDARQPPAEVILAPQAPAMSAEPPASLAKPISTVPEPAAAATPPPVSAQALDSWAARLLAHIEGFKHYPAASRVRREQGTVHVRFTLARDGTLLAARVVGGSGYPQLDREALALLKRAVPFPAIPAEQPAPADISVPIEFFLR